MSGRSFSFNSWTRHKLLVVHACDIKIELTAQTDRCTAPEESLPVEPGRSYRFWDYGRVDTGLTDYHRRITTWADLPDTWPRRKVGHGSLPTAQRVTSEE